MAGKWNMKRVRAFNSKGFLTNGGGRWVRRWDDAMMSFNGNRKAVGAWSAVFRGNDGLVVRTKYEDVGDYTGMIEDFFVVIKEKTGYDMRDNDMLFNVDELILDIDDENFTTEFMIPELEETEMSPELIPFDVNKGPEVLIFEAPKPDDDYEPIAIDYEVDDGYEPIELEMEFGSPEATVEAELIAKVQEREYQPLNAYPNFPFGEVNLDNTRLSAKEWGDATGNTTGGPAEVVEVELLNDVKEKDGKHIVEKADGFSAEKNKLPLPRVTPLLIIGGIGVLAYLVFFRNRIQ